MKLKALEAFSCIEEEDLYKLQYDLKSNQGLVLQKLIDDKIKAIENQKRQFCAVCGTDLKGKDNTLTLLFGPDDFRRKGSFCEIDCMEYFVNSHIKKLPGTAQNTSSSVSQNGAKTTIGAGNQETSSMS